MSSPNKNQVVQRPLHLMGQLCRARRREFALRHKTATQLQVLSIRTPEPEQIAASKVRCKLIATSAAESVEQNDGREILLRRIVEACAASVAVLDQSGNLLYMSKPWRLSAEKDYLPAGRHPLDLKCLERRGSSKAASSDNATALREDIQDILDGKIREFHNEYSCTSVTGASWFVVHATRLDLPGRDSAFRVVINSEDTTKTRWAEEALRELGGRLIAAQEEERSRVARELHDDLNQRMALLSIELEQLSQRIPAGPDNIRESIQNVWARAQEISSEIHRVSYQLHPSKLDHLGLVAAARSLCRELATHHEIKITFRDKRCHDLLSKEVTLCLFRIIQESLRNVIKHSGGREATVVLTGAKNVVHLSVSDTGRGFDATSIEAKSGLGLISMRERLRSVGGAISIHSTARGTKIEVSIPIAASTIDHKKRAGSESGRAHLR
jgi:signal transduction histidine kinase